MEIARHDGFEGGLVAAVALLCLATQQRKPQLAAGGRLFSANACQEYKLKMNYSRLELQCCATVAADGVGRVGTDCPRFSLHEWRKNPVPGHNVKGA